MGGMDVIGAIRSELVKAAEKGELPVNPDRIYPHTMTLAEAWQIVEETLIDGWEIASLDKLRPHDASAPYWEAEASKVIDGRWAGSNVSGQGEDAIHALLDLHAELLVNPNHR
jgi:hypothetical protein